MNKTELWIAVDKLLWEKWDPIGVKGYGGPDDEYRSYVPSIMSLLNDNADETKIKKLLHQHANISMGLSTSLESHTEVAKKLIELKMEC